MRILIPKVIHYCWFGKGELPKLAKECIESWKKFCPEYEIIEGNETNFDINSNMYVKQAYESKKYAFVSDYVRLYALYNNGGIYMDTDVEVLRNIDEFLENESFSGFETNNTVPTGIMGSCKEHPFYKYLLSYYEDRVFIKEDGSYDLKTNVETITEYCKDKGLKLNNSLQTIDGFTLYPSEYFCPKNYKTGKINLTENTFTIHHFSGSWVPKSKKIKNEIKKLIGIENTNKIIGIKKKIKKLI